MSNITSLQQRKKNDRLSDLKSRIQEVKDGALMEFSSLESNKTIIGSWDDSSWMYKNKTIYFTKPFDCDGVIVTGSTKRGKRVPIEEEWADTLKIYALSLIKGGKSGKAASGNIGAVIWFCDSLSYDMLKLLKLKQRMIDDVYSLMGEYLSEGSCFEKYKIIVNFVKNPLIANKLCPHFMPLVNVKNPRLKNQDVTQKEYTDRRENKFDEDIDRYISLAKRRFEAERERTEKREEPVYKLVKPEADELRFLAVPFLLVFGLRIGELSRLTENCLQYDEINQRWYLNVLTEKGQLPSPRPVPRIWEQVIVDSFNRIKELTESDRQYAKLVERNGLNAFLDQLSLPRRTEKTEKILVDHGHDPSDCFLRQEFFFKQENHESGIRYSSMRMYTDNSKRPDGVYSSSKAGQIAQGKNIMLVFSKRKLAGLLFDRYKEFQRIVFQENDVDADDSLTYSSASFSMQVPFSRHLFIAREDTFGLGSNENGIIPKPLTARTFSNWLIRDEVMRGGTVFERFDVRNPDRKIVQINTHQFRHWLSTALMRSGKNEMMVDMFMGRTAGQTRHYDHRTSKERAENIRDKYLSQSPPDDALGRRIKRMRGNDVSLDEIQSVLEHTFSVVHYTPWGTCKRDLDVSPCEKGMMCLRGEDGKGCGHFGIDPTDEEAKQSIINTKVHYENQLNVLIPNYESLMETLNQTEPLDQHVQYCMDTIQGCEHALKAYENYEKDNSKKIDVVQVFEVEEE